MRNPENPDLSELVFLDIHQTEYDEYYFVYKDMADERIVYKSDELFLDYDDCLNAGRGHELFFIDEDQD